MANPYTWTEPVTNRSSTTDRMTYENINNVEQIELDCYGVLAAYEHIPDMNHYVGDKWTSAYRYAGDAMNSGGRYD